MGGRCKIRCRFQDYRASITDEEIGTPSLKTLGFNRYLCKLS